MGPTTLPGLRARSVRRGRSTPRVAISVFGVCCLVMGSLRVFADTGLEAATSSATSPVIEEVDVTGEHPGPGLWRVTRRDHVLWLLGTLDPLPRKMEWRSRETESVIAEAEELLYEQPSVSVGGNPFTWVRAYFRWRQVQAIPGNGTLKDWIRPDLYARFAALETRFDPRDSRTEKLRPVFAALRLYGRALDASRLTPGPQTEESVLRLARKHHVSIRQPKVRVDDPAGLISQLGDISRGAHEACLEAIVERLESGLENMKAAARAWATGDVTTLRALPSPRDLDVCTDAVASSPRMKSLIEQAKDGWDRELESAIERNRTTLAMQSVYELLGPNGTLAALRQKGYVVEGP
jgi:uncharacterized protein YbaP (TraB family)